MYLDPGKELKVTGYIGYCVREGDISDLIQLPLDDLNQKEQDSIKEEESICSEISDKVNKWETQAAQTVRIRKAKEYLQTYPPSHTSNQWTEDQYGNHEMSNMVYKFSWRLYERTTWDRTLQKSVVTGWELTWNLYFNTVSNPDHSSGRHIAGQDRKVFKEKAAMEKYLQGRIAAYAHLFTELSPLIPKEHKKLFYVNGILLPGYTVEDPDALKPNEAALDDLLSLLDDADIGGEAPAPPSEPQPEEKSPQAIWEKHRKKRTGGSQRQQPPAR